jgi:hypothetical protein
MNESKIAKSMTEWRGRFKEVLRYLLSGADRGILENDLRYAASWPEYELNERDRLRQFWVIKSRGRHDRGDSHQSEKHQREDH